MDVNASTMCVEEARNKNGGELVNWNGWMGWSRTGRRACFSCRIELESLRCTTNSSILFLHSVKLRQELKPKDADIKHDDVTSIFIRLKLTSRLQRSRCEKECSFEFSFVEPTVEACAATPTFAPLVFAVYARPSIHHTRSLCLHPALSRFVRPCAPPLPLPLPLKVRKMAGPKRPQRRRRRRAPCPDGYPR